MIERNLLSATIRSNYVNSGSVVPGVTIVTAWTIYMISIALWNLRRGLHQQIFFGACLKLGGSLQPDNFKLSKNDDKATGEAEEVDLITIIEEDYITVRGASYDKNRYQTLVLQMRAIRRVFLLLGALFLFLSVPTSLVMMYFTSVLSVISSRVSRMGSRTDAVYNTMELLDQERDNLTTLAQDITATLSSASVQGCFQNDPSLLEISNSILSSMTGLELDQRDIYEVIESATDASGISNEMSYHFDGFVNSAWLAIISITFLNLCIVILMVGTRAARRGNCGSKQNLIYSYITFPIAVFFSALLLMSVAAFSFAMIVNANFCGGDPNDSVLKLLVHIGLENSSIYFFIQHYMEGCANGNGLGRVIIEYSNNLRNSIVDTSILQALMSSVDCDAFLSLSAKIDTFNNNFESTSQRLDSASYIMSCENVSNWYSDLTVRATCTDLWAFSLSSFIFMFILVLVVSVILSLSISLKSNINLFLELNYEDSGEDDETNGYGKSGRLYISYENQSRSNLRKNHDLDQREQQSSTAKVDDNSPRHVIKRRHIREQNSAKIERMKEELEKVFSIEDTPAIESGEMPWVDDIEERLSPRNISPTQMYSKKMQTSPLQRPFSPIQELDFLPLSESNENVWNTNTAEHFYQLTGDNYLEDLNEATPEQGRDDMAPMFENSMESNEMVEKDEYMKEQLTGRPTSPSLSQLSPQNIGQRRYSPRIDDLNYFLDTQGKIINRPTNAIELNSVGEIEAEFKEMFFDDETDVAISSNIPTGHEIKEEISNVPERQFQTAHNSLRGKSPEHNSDLNTRPKIQSHGATKVNQTKPSPIPDTEIDDNQKRTADLKELVKIITSDEENPLHNMIKEEIGKQLNREQKKIEEEKTNEALVREELKKLLDLASKSSLPSQDRSQSVKHDDLSSHISTNLAPSNQGTSLAKASTHSPMQNEKSTKVKGKDSRPKSILLNQVQKFDDGRNDMRDNKKQFLFSKQNNMKETLKDFVSNSGDEESPTYLFSEDETLVNAIRNQKGKERTDDIQNQNQDHEMYDSFSLTTDNLNFHEERMRHRDRVLNHQDHEFDRQDFDQQQDNEWNQNEEISISLTIDNNHSDNYSVREVSAVQHKQLSDLENHGRKIQQYSEAGRSILGDSWHLSQNDIPERPHDLKYPGSEIIDGRETIESVGTAYQTNGMPRRRTKEVTWSDIVKGNDKNRILQDMNSNAISIVSDDQQRMIDAIENSAGLMGPRRQDEYANREIGAAANEINQRHIGAFRAAFDRLNQQHSPQITQQTQESNTFDQEVGPYHHHDNTDFTAQRYHHPSRYVDQHEPRHDFQPPNALSNNQGTMQYTGSQVKSFNAPTRSSDNSGTFKSPITIDSSKGTFERLYFRNQSIDSVRSKPYKLKIPLSNSYDSYEYSSRNVHSRGSRSASTRSYSTRAFSESSYSGSSSYSDSYSTRSYSTGSFSESSRSSGRTSYTSYTSSTDTNRYDSRRRSSRRRR